MNNKKNIFSALLAVIFVSSISAATKKNLSKQKKREILAMQVEAYGLLKKGERPPTNNQLSSIQEKFKGYPGGQNHFNIVLESLGIANHHWFDKEEIDALMQKIQQEETKKDEN